MSLEAELAAAFRASAADPARFDWDAWALRVFRHQFERNAPYRAFCERRGVGPSTVAAWADVPAVPTRAFRTAALACGPPEATFVTSGTSGGPDARGRHLVPHLDLYRASALPTFERFVLPDGERLPCVFLLPPPSLRPESSLVHMCAWVGESLGTSVEWMAGPSGLDVPALAARLAALEASGDAVLLAGPTAGFVALFDTGRTFRLGPGSRVMDTGGQKGLARPVSRAGFLRACWTHLGIPTYYCVNEYGMTELCSQRYDSVLADRFSGRSLDARRLVAPPWLRTRVVDPDTLAPVRAGEVGLLCHHDLANAGSVSVVLTEDLGRAVGDDGIELMGRVPGAVPRGCGLLLADLEGA
jgi:acyl-protein synthetase LuxE